MTGQDDEDALWDAQMQATARFGQRREWALKTEDPTPAYKDKEGWALDQFAMQFEQLLLRRYKTILIDASKPLIEQKFTANDLLEAEGALQDKVKNHYLHDRFRVEGIRPGDHVPTVVPRALLENMFPDIVLSALAETTPLAPRRRFEYIRVFDLQVRAKGVGGRPSTYNWPTLVSELERDKPDIFSVPDLVRYCRAYVTQMPGKRRAKDGPDDKTIRDVIDRYELKKFIKSR